MIMKMQIPNGLGCLSGIAQLGLYMMSKRAMPNINPEQKTTNHQQQPVMPIWNIHALKTSPAPHTHLTEMNIPPINNKICNHTIHNNV